MPLTLRHQTIIEFVARFRAAYRNSTGDELVKLSKFMLDRIAAGDITDTQARTPFGSNVGDWNIKKANMLILVNNSASVRTAVGD